MAEPILELSNSGEHANGANAAPSDPSPPRSQVTNVMNSVNSTNSLASTGDEKVLKWTFIQFTGPNRFMVYHSVRCSGTIQ